MIDVNQEIRIQMLLNELDRKNQEITLLKEGFSHDIQKNIQETTKSILQTLSVKEVDPQLVLQSFQNLLKSMDDLQKIREALSKINDVLLGCKSRIPLHKISNSNVYQTEPRQIPQNLLDSCQVYRRLVDYLNSLQDQVEREAHVGQIQLKQLQCLQQLLSLKNDEIYLGQTLRQSPNRKLSRTSFSRISEQKDEQLCDVKSWNQQLYEPKPAHQKNEETISPRDQLYHISDQDYKQKYEKYDPQDIKSIQAYFLNNIQSDNNDNSTYQTYDDKFDNFIKRSYVNPVKKIIQPDQIKEDFICYPQMSDKILVQHQDTDFKMDSSIQSILVKDVEQNFSNDNKNTIQQQINFQIENLNLKNQLDERVFQIDDQAFQIQQLNSQLGNANNIAIQQQGNIQIENLKLKHLLDDQAFQIEYMTKEFQIAQKKINNFQQDSKLTSRKNSIKSLNIQDHHTIGFKQQPSQSDQRQKSFDQCETKRDQNSQIQQFHSKNLQSFRCTNSQNIYEDQDEQHEFIPDSYDDSQTSRSQNQFTRMQSQMNNTLFDDQKHQDTQFSQTQQNNTIQDENRAKQRQRTEQYKQNIPVKRQSYEKYEKQINDLTEENLLMTDIQNQLKEAIFHLQEQNSLLSMQMLQFNNEGQAQIQTENQICVTIEEDDEYEDNNSQKHSYYTQQSQEQIKEQLSLQTILIQVKILSQNLKNEKEKCLELQTNINILEKCLQAKDDSEIQLKKKCFELQGQINSFEQKSRIQDETEIQMKNYEQNYLNEVNKCRDLKDRLCSLQLDYQKIKNNNRIEKQVKNENESTLIVDQQNIHNEMLKNQDQQNKIQLLELQNIIKFLESSANNELQKIQDQQNKIEFLESQAFNEVQKNLELSNKLQFLKSQPNNESQKIQDQQNKIEFLESQANKQIQKNQELSNKLQFFKSQANNELQKIKDQQNKIQFLESQAFNEVQKNLELSNKLQFLESQPNNESQKIQDQQNKIQFLESQSNKQIQKIQELQNKLQFFESQANNELQKIQDQQNKIQFLESQAFNEVQKNLELSNKLQLFESQSNNELQKIKDQQNKIQFLESQSNKQIQKIQELQNKIKILESQAFNEVQKNLELSNKLQLFESQANNEVQKSQDQQNKIEFLESQAFNEVQKNLEISNKLQFLESQANNEVQKSQDQQNKIEFLESQAFNEVQKNLELSNKLQFLESQANNEVQKSQDCQNKIEFLESQAIKQIQKNLELSNKLQLFESQANNEVQKSQDQQNKIEFLEYQAFNEVYKNLELSNKLQFLESQPSNESQKIQDQQNKIQLLESQANKQIQKNQELSNKIKLVESYTNKEMMENQELYEKIKILEYQANNEIQENQELQNKIKILEYQANDNQTLIKQQLDMQQDLKRITQQCIELKNDLFDLEKSKALEKEHINQQKMILERRLTDEMNKSKNLEKEIINKESKLQDLQIVNNQQQFILSEIRSPKEKSCDLDDKAESINQNIVYEQNDNTNEKHLLEKNSDQTNYYVQQCIDLQESLSNLQKSSTIENDQLTLQNSFLQKQLKDEIIKIGELKAKISISDSQNFDNRIFQIKLSNLETENQLLKKNLEQLKLQNIQYLEKSFQMENSLNENLQNQELISQLEHELQVSKSQIEDVMIQVRQLKKIEMDLLAQNLKLQQEREVNDIQDHQRQIQINTNQFEVSDEIKQLKVENQQLKLTIQQTQAIQVNDKNDEKQIPQIELSSYFINKIQSLEKELLNSMSENVALKNRCKEFQNLRSANSDLVDQNTILQQEIIERLDEMQQFKQKTSNQILILQNNFNDQQYRLLNEESVSKTPKIQQNTDRGQSQLKNSVQIQPSPMIIQDYKEVREQSLHNRKSSLDQIILPENVHKYFIQKIEILESKVEEESRKNIVLMIELDSLEEMKKEFELLKLQQAQSKRNKVVSPQIDSSCSFQQTPLQQFVLEYQPSKYRRQSIEEFDEEGLQSAIRKNSTLSEAIQSNGSINQMMVQQRKEELNYEDLLKQYQNLQEESERKIISLQNQFTDFQISYQEQYDEQLKSVLEDNISDLIKQFDLELAECVSLIVDQINWVKSKFRELIESLPPTELKKQLISFSKQIYNCFNQVEITLNNKKSNNLSNLSLNVTLERQEYNNKILVLQETIDKLKNKPEKSDNNEVQQFKESNTKLMHQNLGLKGEIVRLQKGRSHISEYSIDKQCYTLENNLSRSNTQRNNSPKKTQPQHSQLNDANSKQNNNLSSFYQETIDNLNQIRNRNKSKD